MHMLILQGMGEFRAGLISSATAYHLAPEAGRERWREKVRFGVGEKLGMSKESGNWESERTEGTVEQRN